MPRARHLIFPDRTAYACRDNKTCAGECDGKSISREELEKLVSKILGLDGGAWLDLLAQASSRRRGNIGGMNLHQFHFQATRISQGASDASCCRGIKTPIF